MSKAPTPGPLGIKMNVALAPLKGPPAMHSAHALGETPQNQFFSLCWILVNKGIKTLAVARRISLAKRTNRAVMVCHAWGLLAPVQIGYIMAFVARLGKEVPHSKKNCKLFAAFGLFFSSMNF